MPRKRRDEDTILSFWKQFARDKDCPWSLRVWSTFALAVATKMLPLTIPPPGAARFTYKEQSDAAVIPDTPSAPVAEIKATDVKDFWSKVNSGGINV